MRTDKLYRSEERSECVREDCKVVWPDWEVVEPIGRGSYGTVYKIRRDVYGEIEEAALKVITIPQDDELEYFRSSGMDSNSITNTFHKKVGEIAREYNLMKKMRGNPNIVYCDDFRDIQHDDGIGWDIYIKMELLTPLMKALHLVQTEKQIIRFGMDMCSALIACQEENIIHRDIKPQNVFVSDKGQFKLGDFGIARTIERTTVATASIGTFSYMAPEVRNSQTYNHKADIYSLGLMLYWLLNERRLPFLPMPPAAFDGDDLALAQGRRFSGEPFAPPKNGSEYLKALVMTACSYVPKNRFCSAQAMYNALQALDQGNIPAPRFPEPSPNPVPDPGPDRDSEPVRTWKWMRLE